MELNAIAVLALSIIGLGLATWDIRNMWSSLEQKNGDSKDKPHFDKSLCKLEVFEYSVSILCGYCIGG